MSSELRGIGYRDVWLGDEPGSRDDDRSHPILVLASSAVRHSLFVEVADGAEIDPRRLEPYAKLTAVDLRRATRLSREQTETYSVAVFGRDEHRGTLRASIARASVRPTLILKTPDGLALDANPFVKAALTNVFRPILAVDWPTAPMSWIPFDHNSSLADVAGAVVPEVIRRLLHGESLIELDAVCRGQALWGLTTATGRRKLRERIREALADASIGEMRMYFSLCDDVIEAADPEDAESDGAAERQPPVRQRTLRIASMRFAQLLARLREQAEPDPAPDPPLAQPDSSSTSTRASSGGS